MLQVILLTFVLKRAGKTTQRCISASRLAGNEISTAIPMFSGSNISIVLSVTLPDGTGSQKFKMVAEIMRVTLSQLIHLIATKFLRLRHIFGVGQHEETNGGSTVRCLGMS